MPNNLISSPPNLPAYLRDIYELKPIFGTPSDDEVTGIHAVIQMAQKAVDIPGTGDPLLLAKLAEHLFNVQMAKYRIKYLTATFPENTTYKPPTLPTHLTVQLEPVVGAPSEEDIVNVQNAIRTYRQLVNSESEILQEFNRINSLHGGFHSVSSMFDPRINMELSQHLFDIQMAKYTQRARQSHATLVSTTIPNSSAMIAVEQTSNEAQEEPTTNNSGTGANNTFASSQSVQTGSDPAVREYLQTSNRLAEQANQLVERSNLLIERSNQLAERANELVGRSQQSAEQTNSLIEKFTGLFERMNDHFEQSNSLAKSFMKPMENIGDILKNINKVLVAIQYAIVRSRKDNTAKAADCLVNEKGEIPGQSTETGYASFEWLSWRFGNQPDCQFPVVIGDTTHTLHIDDTWLCRFLRFYGACTAFCEDGMTMLKPGCEKDARLLFGRYLSTCLG